MAGDTFTPTELSDHDKITEMYVDLKYIKAEINSCTACKGKVDKLEHDIIRLKTYAAIGGTLIGGLAVALSGGGSGILERIGDILKLV